MRLKHDGLKHVFKGLLCLPLVCMLLLSGKGQAQPLTLTQRVWVAELDAAGRLDTSLGQGTLALKKDLGIQGTRMGELRAEWQPNTKTTIFASRFTGTFRGEKSLVQEVGLFGGLFTVDITHQISSLVSLDYRKVGWAQKLGCSKDKDVNVQLLLDVKHVAVGARAQVDSQFMGNTLHNSLRYDQTFTGPTLGMAVDARISPRLVLRSEISGVPRKVAGFSFMDWDTNALIALGDSGNVHATVGYRAVKFHDRRAENRENTISAVNLTGWVYGLQIKF